MFSCAGSACSSSGAAATRRSRYRAWSMFCWITRANFSVPCSLSAIHTLSAWNPRESSKPKSESHGVSTAVSPRSPSPCARYDGVSEKVSSCACASRTSTQPTGYVRFIHLCRSKASESARSMPVTSCRDSGAMAAQAPKAPSTWNHKSSAAQKSASAGSGSIDPVLVVPATPTTQTGRSPAARSLATISASAPRSMRMRSSLGTRRSDVVPIPSSSTALVSDECASVEQYTVRRAGAPDSPSPRTSNPAPAFRATASAIRLEAEHPLVSSPPASSGYPSSPLHQSSTCSST